MRRVTLGGTPTGFAAAIVPASAHAQSPALARISNRLGLAEEDAAGYAGITVNDREDAAA